MFLLPFYIDPEEHEECEDQKLICILFRIIPDLRGGLFRFVVFLIVVAKISAELKFKEGNHAFR
jgi:hypothetical protein